MAQWRTPDEVARSCYFCGDRFRLTPGTKPEDEDWAEEVGEFWSESMQDSFLGHPDCLPMGFEATWNGEDPEWKLA